MKAQAISRVSFLMLFVGTLTSISFAQGRFKIITGKLLTDATPRDFYLEGNAIPVEKDNAVLINTPAGARAIFALIVTAGFASRIQQKYSGMLITEGHISICGVDVAVGSYGFGLRRTPGERAQRAVFLLYNQAGSQIMTCNMRQDQRLREPKPLQVIIRSPRSARFYLGRYWLKLGP